MVETEDQYIFIYNAIVDYLKSKQTEVDVNELRDYIKKQCQVDALAFFRLILNLKTKN